MSGIVIRAAFLLWPMGLAIAQPLPVTPMPALEKAGPPPILFSSCAGKSEGMACSFQNPKGDVLTGICRMPTGPGMSQYPIACFPSVKIVPPGAVLPDSSK